MKQNKQIEEEADKIEKTFSFIWGVYLLSLLVIGFFCLLKGKFY